jgi:hypothetical protein
VLLDGFLPLRLVPDEHAVGRDTDPRLAREVIPAEHAHRDGNAKAARRFQIIHLRRTGIGDRRQQQDVGSVRPQKGVERIAPRQQFVATHEGVADRVANRAEA